jgi:hypothetical protein
MTRHQPVGQNVALNKGNLSGSIVKSKNKMPFNLCLLMSSDNIQLTNNRNSTTYMSRPRRRVLLDMLIYSRNSPHYMGTKRTWPRSKISLA